MDYVLSQKTADRLREVLHSPEGGRYPPSGFRQVSFVRVTNGLADGDGFYECLPTEYATDALDWEDLADADAVVIGAMGEDLALDERYLALRAGDTEDGDAVYVAVGNLWGFAAYVTAGVVSAVNQYLGAGTKSVDALGLPSTPGTLATSDPTIRGYKDTASTAFYAPAALLVGDGDGGPQAKAIIVASVLIVGDSAGSGSTQAGGWQTNRSTGSGPTYYPSLSWAWLRDSTGAGEGGTVPSNKPMQLRTTGTTDAPAVPVGLNSTSGWLQVGGVIEATYHDATYLANARFRCRGLDGASGTDALGNVVTGGIITTVGAGTGGGSGTVTTVSVVTANGLAGTVANATTTPAITLTTTVTGVLKGNGTAISAATANTDYTNPAGLAAYAQPLDATLTALAAANWAANALPVGSGADTLSQVSFAANTFPARASTGNLVAKTITDFGLSLVDDADAAAARTTILPSKTGNTLKVLRVNAGETDYELATPSALDITGLAAAEPALDDETPIYDVSATANKKATWQKGLGLLRVSPGGRLALSSTDPLGVSTGSSGLYYLPYEHDVIVLWDGTRWLPVQFPATQVTGAALSGLTTASNYDVFGYLSSGALACEILIWSSSGAGSSSRATAVTLQDGRFCKSGDKTRLYLGTFRSSSTTQTMDTGNKRFVWNMYNPVRKSLQFDMSGNWTYGTATWRQCNGTAGNQVECVLGMNAHAHVRNLLYVIGSVGAGASAGVGVDSTSTVSGHWCENQSPAPSLGWIDDMYAAGYHVFYALEIARAGTLNIYASSANAVQGGLLGHLLC